MALDMSSLNMSFSKESLSQFTISHFSLTDFLLGVKPLMYFIIGMTVYAIFVFKFYKFLARRDIIHFKTRYYESYEGILHHLGRGIFYFFENLVIIPLLVFFWFIVLATLLLLLSKNTNPDSILLVSASIVAAVRITSYYSENLSQDLAKMIPFALLGVFLVDVSYFSLDSSIEIAKALPDLTQYMIYYLLFVTLLEFVLRFVHGLSRIFIKREAKVADEDSD